MQRSYKKRLGEILIAAGLVTKEQLDQALDEQKKTGKRLGHILIDMGYVTEEDITETWALQLDIPHVYLSDYAVDPDVIQLVSENIARTHSIIPVSRQGDRLVVAMSNPLDVETIDLIQRETRLRVEPLMAPESHVQRAVMKHYTASGNHNGADLTSSIDEAIMDISYTPKETDYYEEDVNEARRQSDQAPVIRMVNLMIAEAVRSGASDIHLEPRAKTFELRYRVDGVLRHVRDIPKSIQAACISRIKIMGEMDISERRLPQDGRATIRAENRLIDLRISTLPTIYGERVVMRILDKANSIAGLDRLGFSESDLERFNSLIRKPYGIILVTGPTGSGKTTTLYSVLNAIKSEETNIITVEDPVEYEMSGISQSNVNVRAGLTFAAQLRSILRQDPDVILVGEIRDMETADIAFRAALTGHLVFATLHCNSAPSAIPRLLDMDVESFLISSAIIGVLAQRLVRVLCPHCAAPYVPSGEEINRIGLSAESDPLFHRPVGCSYCNGGFKGRMGVFELMTMNNEIQDMARLRASYAAIKDAAVRAGMTTMQQDAAQKILRGITSFDEVEKRVFVEDEDVSG
ncbi:MAG: Flp pilus assembly complex ATPase component TadA [Armatimonadetes bacterium]|nr:Flp pilus assembly complex ATPase component TadA [Armatimonadota bacterium]